MHRDDSLWGEGWVVSEATSPSSLERNHLKELYNNKTNPKTSINMQKYPEHFNAS